MDTKQSPRITPTLSDHPWPEEKKTRREKELLPPDEAVAAVVAEVCEDDDTPKEAIKSPIIPTGSDTECKWGAPADTAIAAAAAAVEVDSSNDSSEDESEEDESAVDYEGRADAVTLEEQHKLDIEYQSQIIDPNYIASLLDFRPWVFPVTQSRVNAWIFYALLVWFGISTGSFDLIAEYITSNIDVVMALAFAGEPLLSITFLYFAAYEQRQLSATPTGSSQGETAPDPPIIIYENVLPRPVPDTLEFRSDPRFANREIAVIVACHNSADVIEATVKNLLVHFFPNQIFIIDNGTNIVGDDTRFRVKSINRHIVVHEVDYGNKTWAQKFGTLIGANFPYATVLDDDVLVPETFKTDIELIKTQDYDAICYPIRAEGVHGSRTWVTECQKLEYAMSDGAKSVQHQFGGVQMPHGAISTWKMSTLVELLWLHTTNIIYEDALLGLMLIRQKGLCGTSPKMAMSYQPPIATIAPMSFFGPAPNLDMQRRRRWEPGSTYCYLTLLGTVLHICLVMDQAHS